MQACNHNNDLLIFMIKTSIILLFVLLFNIFVLFLDLHHLLSILLLYLSSLDFQQINQKFKSNFVIWLRLLQTIDLEMLHHHCLSHHIFPSFVFVFKVTQKYSSLLWKQTILKQYIKFFVFYIVVLLVYLLEKLLNL
jgi:hypothetical protein